MTTAAPVLRVATAAIAFLGGVAVLFDPPARLVLFGAASGSLYGLAAVGVILVYRTHRVINFAAIAIGALPAVIVALLQALHGLPYFPALALALAGGAALGALVEVVVVRRFAGTPRLLLMIATLAVAQVIALVSERVAARLVTDRDVPSRVPTPFDGVDWLDSDGAPILTGDHITAAVVLLAAASGLTWFFRSTRSGISLRAAAENLDRARVLAVPVARLHTAAWAIAGLIAASAVFFRIPLVGVPLDPTLGPEITLFVVAAAAIARFEDVPIAVVSGVAIGILEQASVARIGSANLTSAVMLAVIVPALLLRRRDEIRADREESSWDAVAEPRPTPSELRRLPAVRRTRWATASAVAVLAVAAPYVVSDGEVGKLTLIPITAIVGVSLVVLTGWAGHVSLGQFAFAGLGGGFAGGLAANHTVDFFVALLAAIAVGAVAAVMVGLPAAKVRGVYLAVTTLALAASTEFYLLEKGYPVHRLLLPHGEAPRVDRPALWGVIDLTDERAFYFAAVLFLGIALVVARSFRRSRSGRVVLATRDNPHAAAAYGVNTETARLAAFGVSGALAGLGGALLVYQQGTVDAGAFGVAASIQLFLMTVLGGIASPAGAVLGAAVLKSVQFFVEPHFTGASLLFEGPLLLVVLLVNPGGLSAAVERLRGRWLARALRHDEPVAHAPALELSMERVS